MTPRGPVGGSRREIHRIKRKNNGIDEKTPPHAASSAIIEHRRKDISGTTRNEVGELASTRYDANAMRELSGLDPIRQNPAQYIGDTSAVSVTRGTGNEIEGEEVTGGGLHLFVEVCGNASDEATNAGPDGRTYADRVEIVLHKDQSITVTDNGRGIPPDVNAESGKTGIEMAFLTMNAGGKFKAKTDPTGGNYKTAQGLHGVGAACVAALSDLLDVTVWRDGIQYEMSARRGKPGQFKGDRFVPAKDGETVVRASRDPRPVERKREFPHGTSVHWHPDPVVWGGTDIPLFDVYRYVAAQSYMAPRCTYTIIDRTGSEEKVTEYHHPGGINDMVEEKTASMANVTPTISFDVPSSYTKRVVLENEDGGQSATEVTYGCTVKAAIRWTGGDGVDLEGYANGVHCRGKHVDGFRQGLAKAVVDWVSRDSGVPKKSDPTPTLDDVVDGLVAVVEVLLDEQCYFTSQTKDVLNNAEVRGVAYDVAKEQVTQWLSARKNATMAKRLARSVMENARYRKRERERKEEAKKVKEKLGVSVKPAKLSDCRNEGPGTELLICEGDSAGGTIRQARDAGWQAVFPVRGVSLNCYGATDAKVLANAEFAGIVNAMRAGGIGKSFDMANRRYDRIGIYTDADEDGNYIRSLLLVFIYTQLPGMIEAGKVFAGMPPLYSIKFLKGPRKGEVEYVQDEAARDEFVEKWLRDGGDLSALEISRQKGLGEVDADEFDLCLSPKTRQVRVITVDDVEDNRERAEAALKMLFGKGEDDKQTRRAWIDDTFESVTE